MEYVIRTLCGVELAVRVSSADLLEWVRNEFSLDNFVTSSLLFRCELVFEGRLIIQLSRFFIQNS